MVAMFYPFLNYGIELSTYKFKLVNMLVPTVPTYVSNIKKLGNASNNT